MSKDRCIVVADRSRKIRSILVRELKRDGFRVVQAKDATELCERLAHCTAPLLLIVAPDLPGLEEHLSQVLTLSASVPSILYSHSDDVGEPRLVQHVLEQVEKNGDVGHLQEVVKRYAEL